MAKSPPTLKGIEADKVAGIRKTPFFFFKLPGITRFPLQRTIDKMTRRGSGKLAKSGVPHHKDMLGGSLGSRAESMKLLIFYKSEGEWEGGPCAAREMRWYRRANKKDGEEGGNVFS